MALDLVDFDELKNLLDFGKAESNYPALEVLEKRVAAAVQDYLGRQLEKKERTEETTLAFATVMHTLKGIPVESVSSVSLNNFGQVDTLQPDELMIVSYGIETAMALGPGVLTVTYTGGYKNKAIPDGIRQAATIQLAYEYQNKDFIGAETVSSEGGTRTTPALQLLKEVRRMLDRHRHPMRMSA